MSQFSPCFSRSLCLGVLLFFLKTAIYSSTGNYIHVSSIYIPNSTLILLLFFELYLNFIAHSVTGLLLPYSTLPGSAIMSALNIVLFVLLYHGIFAILYTPLGQHFFTLHPVFMFQSVCFSNN